jgi:predicted nucleic acid-binding protein
LRFWDSSAVVPLLVEQSASTRAASWLESDGVIVLWTLTPVEVASAVHRLLRDGTLDEEAARIAEARLDELVDSSHVMLDLEPIKSTARRLLRVHSLRAFDALQLAAALHWSEGNPRGLALYTLDNRLALAARREGFVVPE